jgi:enoyl-CoA hydratase
MVMSTEPLILTDTPRPGVGHIMLNRPLVHNALNQAIMRQLITQLGQWTMDESIHAVVISGGESKAFAAGADIKELARLTVAGVLQTDPLVWWDILAQFPKPLISAVHGLALGGGFELVLASDFVITTDDASFGLPELSLGVIPGAGGTQRLTRVLGKYRAMEMILAEERLTAKQALDWGIVYQLHPTKEQAVENALVLAEKLAKKPLLAVLAAKKAIQAAKDHGLTTGVQMERQLFYQLFATDDKQEGMAAFLEKRLPLFTHQ